MPQDDFFDGIPDFPSEPPEHIDPATEDDSPEIETPEPKEPLQADSPPEHIDHVDSPTPDLDTNTSETSEPRHESLGDEYRRATLVEMVSDDNEMAYFARETGIDPDDPHPGAEALHLLRSMLDASARLGEVLADRGSAICGMLDDGTKRRESAAASMGKARYSIDTATTELTSAREALECSVADFMDRTGSAAASMRSGIEAASDEMARRSSEMLAGHLSKSVDASFENGMSRLASSLDSSRAAILSSIETGTDKLSKRMLRHADQEAKRFEKAMVDALLEAERRKMTTDPWRWRFAAIFMAGLVACMGLSWMIGKDLGIKSGVAERQVIMQSGPR